ncbi:MAG: hypothetical protein WDO19_13505 [Bacteroidota bacterium]
MIIINPELAAALSDIWLLHGFKPKEKLNSILNNVDELGIPVTRI